MQFYKSNYSENVLTARTASPGQVTAAHTLCAIAHQLVTCDKQGFKNLKKEAK